jgi:ribose 5-phosphate isomerase B
VLCIGAGEFPADDLVAWTRLWLETPFEGGRHARRVGKFQALEQK